MKRREYILSLVMLASLFFIFGLVSWVNSILVPYFKVACDLKTGFFRKQPGHLATVFCSVIERNHESLISICENKQTIL